MGTEGCLTNSPTPGSPVKTCKKKKEKRHTPNKAERVRVEAPVHRRQDKYF